MGRELYQQYPVYASSLDRASAHLSSIGASFSLLEELAKDEQSTQVNVAHVSQPACTAVQLALVELLRSWRVAPTAVVGHSSGEIAAAYSAGIITFEDAMTIAYHRGRIIPILKQRFPDLDGCMLAVGAGFRDISPLLERVPPSLGEARIACINSPSSVTVSGDAEAVAEIQRLIEDVHPGTFVRRLAVDTAYHSHHMNLVAKDYTESLRKLLPPRPSDVVFHSSLLGRNATYLDLDATYWVQNLTCAVRFDDAVQSMCAPVEDFKTGVSFLIELGPHAALQGPLKQTLKHTGGAATKIPYSSMLSRSKDAVQTALALAGTLFVKGHNLDMGAINFPKTLERLPQVLTDMPRYAWNHSTNYYHESRLTKVHKFSDTPRNDLLGVLASYSDDIEPTWRNVLRLDDIPWLRHHQMQGVTIFPISGFLVMSIEAAAQQADTKGFRYDLLEVQDLYVTTPVMLTEEDLEMTMTLRPHLALEHFTSFRFHIRSWSTNKGWSEHCTGLVSVSLLMVNEVDGHRVSMKKQRRLDARVSAIRKAATEPVNTQAMYKQLADISVGYGATLQSVDDCHASILASRAQIVVADTAAEMPEHQETKYIVHPTILEQLIAMYWPVLSVSGPLNTVHLPSSISKVTIATGQCAYLQGSGSRIQAFCDSSKELLNHDSNTLSMFALSETGESLISIENVSISPIVEAGIGPDAEAARELCYKLDWEPFLRTPEAQMNGNLHANFDADMVIIHGDTESQLNIASMLSDQVRVLTGTVVTTGSLASLATISQDKLCIVITELDKPVLPSLDASDFAALQCLLTSVRGALWVVRGAYLDSKSPESNMIMGLSRTLRSEGTLMKFITLDLDVCDDVDDGRHVDAILQVLGHTLSTDAKTEETEFMERNGQILTPRIVSDDALNTYVDQQIHPSATEPAFFSNLHRPLRGYLKTPNVFNSVTFEDHVLPRLLSDEVEVQVKAICLSAIDIEAISAIGSECSGIVTAVGSNVPNLRPGDRVAGLTASGSLSTVTRAQHPFLLKLPDHTTFESAATLPLAYCTATYALIDQAKLCEGETVLIHDAASAVGQAAVSIAQMVGADIWTTVRTIDEKTLLCAHFSLSEEKILYAGNGDYSASIKEATCGRGMDVIFDVLTESHLQRTTEDTLADFGRRIIISGHQARISTSTRRNTSSISVDINAIIKHRPNRFQRTLANVARMLKNSAIQPLRSVKAYRISEVAAALHEVQAAGQYGKVVIVPQKDDLVMVSAQR
jgi:NADPH:quinone reductase-like Zn-dependent oxidoreductase/malonyl CoA-acyl carrier protein transacylase